MVKEKKFIYIIFFSMVFLFHIQQSESRNHCIELFFLVLENWFTTLLLKKQIIIKLGFFLYVEGQKKGREKELDESGKGSC